MEDENTKVGFSANIQQIRNFRENKFVEALHIPASPQYTIHILFAALKTSQERRLEGGWGKGGVQ